MINENEYDRDFDGIPDRLDSTFNTPDEVLEKKGIKNPNDDIYEKRRQEEQQAEVRKPKNRLRR